jgi:hypothetical protein
MKKQLIPSSPVKTGRKKSRVKDKPDSQPNNANAQKVLRHEIDQLKKIAQQLADFVKPDTGFADMVRFLDVRGKTSTRIATLLKAVEQYGDNNGPMDAIKLALDEVIHGLEEED